eukprot:scaffold7295_cov118-Skeletonema_marinoi.AAC.2
MLEIECSVCILRAVRSQEEEGGLLTNIRCHDPIGVRMIVACFQFELREREPSVVWQRLYGRLYDTIGHRAIRVVAGSAGNFNSNDDKPRDTAAA